MAKDSERASASNNGADGGGRGWPTCIWPIQSTAADGTQATEEEWSSHDLSRFGCDPHSLGHSLRNG